MKFSSWRNRAWRISRFNLTVFQILLFIFFANLSSAGAQSFTLSGSSTTVRDADEYFTDVQGNPKDMNDVCDVGLDNWKSTSETVTDGVWSGTHGATTGPILGFMAVPTLGTNLAVWRDCATIDGIKKKPVNATKYRQVSWKQKTTYPSSWSMMFAKGDYEFAINGFAEYDGYYLPGGGIHTPPNQWVIYDRDTVANAPANYPWQDTVRGMSLWPSFSEPAGGTLSLDWIRLIDPDSSPSYPVSWNFSAGSLGPDNNRSVVIYVDNNNSGFDGIAIKRGLPVSGSTGIKTGFLAPGTYYLYAEVRTHQTFTDSLVRRSNYIGPVVVNGKPVLNFTSPSRISGPEYARDELGDPWDMNQASDVENFVDANGNALPQVFNGIQGFSFANGYLYASSTEDVVGGTVDTQVHFHTGRGNPIDTTYYRWMCVKMQVSPAHMPRDGDSAGSYRAGWVNRVLWARNSQTTSFGSTAAHEIVERSTTYPDLENGFTNYCFDLNDESGHELGSRWGSTPVDVIRFDPFEAQPSTEFIIDSAGLYAENSDSEARLYNITWNLSDPENDAVTVGLYYDTNDSGYDGTLITTLTGQHSGPGSYNWDTANVGQGEYYIYAVVTDSAGNQNKFYTDVIVQVKLVEARKPPTTAPCDFDGDGATDMTIARKYNASGDAQIYTNLSATNTLRVTNSGQIGRDVYTVGDFDGDLTADAAFMLIKNSSIMRHYFYTSSDTLTSYLEFGLPGDVPTNADFDGDNRTDTALFRNGAWFVTLRAGGTLTHNWGTLGDIPVPADYDGDGTDDYAIYRPSTGEWFGISSENGLLIYRQLGLDGDYPMPGDYDGDGRDDFSVYRSSNGLWFICSSASSVCTDSGTLMTPDAGAIPVQADYDGDGKRDMAIYMAGPSLFVYRLSSTGWTLGAKAFGLPGDTVLCPGPLSTKQTVQTVLTPVKATPPPKKVAKPKKKKKKR